MRAALLGLWLALVPLPAAAGDAAQALYGAPADASAEADTQDAAIIDDSARKGLWLAAALGLAGGAGLLLFRRRQRGFLTGGASLQRLASLSLSAGQGVALLQVGQEQILVSTGSGGVRTLRRWPASQGPVPAQSARPPATPKRTPRPASAKHTSLEAQELDSWLAGLAGSKADDDELAARDQPAAVVRRRS